MEHTNGDVMAVDSAPIKWIISPEEEDILAQKREKENDERQIRKISRKLHQLSNARKDALARASASAADPSLAITESERVADDRRAVEDAKENAQIEFDGFLLLLEKLEIVRLAEMRQAEEYERLHQSLLNEHDETRDAISRLKLDLQEAEQTRERKKEYDVIADRINTLPPRSTIQGTISELESEISTIYAEQEATRELLVTKRTMMEDIRQRIREMMFHGKDDTEGLGLVEGDGEPGTSGGAEKSESGSPSNGATPLPSQNADTRQSSSTIASSSNVQGSSSRIASSVHLNPFASEFRPTASPSPQPHSHLPSKRTEELEDGEDVEDVEMGEVSEGEADESTVTIAAPVPQIRVTGLATSHLQPHSGRSTPNSRASPAPASTPQTSHSIPHSSRLKQILIPKDELEEGEASDEEATGGNPVVDEDASSDLTSLSDTE